MSTTCKEPKYIIQSLFDRTAAAIGLLLLLPVLVVVAFLIVCDDGLPVFFTQLRVGRKGKSFRIWKFRTMVSAADGALITAAGDPRITRVGAILRRYKLDELPQLINVLKGEMSLIGPRPEVPEYVNYNAPLWRAILSVRPGITDPAALVYRNEESLLSFSHSPQQFYSESVLPQKLFLSLQYLGTRSFGTDLRLVLLTLRCVVWRRALDPIQIDQLLNDQVTER
jgi:lipopolysaccharide/colanic/teichoic acid biosynthesis glycosyltransferase